MIDELPKSMETRPVEGPEDFIRLMTNIQNEGAGLVRVTAFSAVDCLKMVLQTIAGARDSAVLYWIECFRFLQQVRLVHPVCSGGFCENVLNTPDDLGAVIVFHAHTDKPTGAITAGICGSCWTEKCHEDRHAAVALFMTYMERLMPGGCHHVANVEDIGSETRTIN